MPRLSQSKLVPVMVAGALFVLLGCTSSSTVAQNSVQSLPKPELQAVDGGTEYYGQFTDPLPTDPSYFPIGVWLETILDMPDVEKDIANGINTYVNITEYSDPARLDGTNSYFLAPWPYEGSRGFVISDEVDMWAGPGDGAWTGRLGEEGGICDPESVACGFTVQDHLSGKAEPSGIMKYANYGKGVTFWHEDMQAAQFVNNFQDVLSADNYWFTDPNICSQYEGGTMLDEPRELTMPECRLASNYGWTVDRVRSLVEPFGSKPVWAFVEVGHPFFDPAAPGISPKQIRAAVWSSIIHGARGIVYFNHSFAGDCVSHHVLRDCGEALTTEVGALNHQIMSLASALNSQSVVDGASSDASVDIMVKRDGSSLVVFAASTQHAPQRVTLEIPCAITDSAEVVGEGRRVPVENFRITDFFDDGETVHIYRFSGNRCGL